MLLDMDGIHWFQVGFTEPGPGLPESAKADVLSMTRATPTTLDAMSTRFPRIADFPSAEK
jgi:hypothetical protein